MLKIPVCNRPNKVLLAWALALDLVIALILLVSPGLGSSSSLQVLVAERGQPSPAPGLNSVYPAPAAHSSNYLVIIRDAETKRVIARVTPDEAGVFTVQLAPGRYVLEVQSANRGAVVSDDMPVVDLKRGEVERVTVLVERALAESREYLPRPIAGV